MIRRIIGSILILLPIYPIWVSIMLLWDTNKRFETAQNEILLSSLEIKTGETAEIEVTYPHAHGIVTVNALEAEKSTEADLTIQYLKEDEPMLLKHTMDETPSPFIHRYENPVQVTKLKDFDGNIQFKNMVCGCENMRPTFFLIIILGLGALFAGTGLFLILKKPRQA